MRSNFRLFPLRFLYGLMFFCMVCSSIGAEIERHYYLLQDQSITISLVEIHSGRTISRIRPLYDPHYGSVIISEDLQYITYTPDTGFLGTDSCTFSFIYSDASSFSIGFFLHVGSSTTPTPTVTPSPTPLIALPTPKPPVVSSAWTFTSRRLRDMSGEVLLLLHDLNRDKTMDILAGNSGPADFDPSFMASYQEPAGSFSDFAPLPGAEHMPGYHSALIRYENLSHSILDLRGGVVHSLNLDTMEHDENPYALQEEYIPFFFPLLLGGHDRYQPVAALNTEEGMFLASSVESNIGREYYTLFDSLRGYSVVKSYELPSISYSHLRTYKKEMALLAPNYIATALTWVDKSHLFLIARGMSTIEQKNTLLEIHPDPSTPSKDLVTVRAELSSELPTYLVAADLDGDGDRDLVVREGSIVTTFLNRDLQFDRLSHTFLPKPYQTGGLLFHSNPNGVSFPDFLEPLSMKNTGEFLLQPVDSDTYTDLLSFSGGLIYLPGRGDGTFGEYEYIDPFFHATSCAVADLNGDGASEIVASRGNEVRIYSRPANTASPIRFLPREPMGAVETLAGNRWVSGTTPAIEVGTSFANARRITLGNGLLFVSDAERNQVRIRDEAGQWSVLTDAQGQPPALNSPAGMLVQRGRLYICDSGNNRLLVCDLASQMIESVTGAAGVSFNHPSDIKAYTENELVIADTGSNDVKAWNLETGAIRSLFPPDPALALREPVALAVGADGSLYVTKNIKPGVKRFWQENGAWKQTQLMGGRFGDDYPRGRIGNSMLYPEGVAVLTDGSVVVADAGNQRLLQWKGGRVSVFAGSRADGFQVDGFPRNRFHFQSPSDIAVLSETELLVADGDSIRLIRLGEENPVLPEPIPYDLVPTPPISVDPTPTPPSSSTVREYPIH